MAFEQFFSFPDKIMEEVQKRNKLILDEPDPIVRARYSNEADGLFTSLRIYYETAMQHAKFKAQRDYCIEVMKKINPAYCQGYFKSRKK